MLAVRFQESKYDRQNDLGVGDVRTVLEKHSWNSPSVRVQELLEVVADAHEEVRHGHRIGARLWPGFELEGVGLNQRLLRRK